MKTLARKAILLVGVVTLTSSCSLMLPDRSFIAEMEREDGGFLSPGQDFPVVSGDTGEMRRSREEIMSRTPGSERSRRLNKESVSLREELIQKEDSMTEEEAGRYAQDRKFLQTDSDKLYYLSLSPYERNSYIQTKQMDLKEDLDQRRNMVQRRSIHGSELFLGMEKSEVIDVWGKPARVEIAGNPKNQNERWSFVEDGSVRQVYFENGKVQGWALDL